MIFARPLPRPVTQSRLTWYFGPRVWLTSSERIAWAMVAMLCASVLSVAAYIKPDPRGYGTHERLGLPPCGFILMTGLPCPTCGMTSSFALLMHGHPIRAFVAQPAGMALCLAAIIMVIFGVMAAIQGFMPSIYWDRIGPVKIALTIAFVFVGGWGFKIGLGFITGELPLR